jgi:hypothetical protein
MTAKSATQAVTALRVKNLVELFQSDNRQINKYGGRIALTE